MFKFRRPSLLGRLLTLTVVCLINTGCQHMRERTDAISSSTREMLTWQRGEGTKQRDAPKKIVAIWSESTAFGANHTATRGLGGRIYLFNRNHQAVKAEGELIVYAYDDDLEGGERVQPNRKYVIEAADFETHYTPSEFGPSYSIWIPWDSVGGDTQSISVVPVFRDASGQALVGDHSRNLLSGSGDASTQLAKKQRPLTHPSPTHPSQETAQPVVERVTFQQKLKPGSLPDALTEEGSIGKSSPEDDSPGDSSPGDSSPGDSSPGDSSPGDGAGRASVRTSTFRLPASMRQRVLQDGRPAANDSASSHRPVRGSMREVFDARRERTLAMVATAGQRVKPSRIQTNRPPIRQRPYQRQVPSSPAARRANDRPGWQRDRAALRPGPSVRHPTSPNG